MENSANFIYEREIEAPAKINLDLCVTGRERDEQGIHTGYDLLKSRMHALELSDLLKLRLTVMADKELNCIGAGECGAIRLKVIDERASAARLRSPIPEDERNLVYKAARKYMSAQERGGLGAWKLEIELVKRIPAGAGLGGGSTDAAAVLVFLQEALEAYEKRAAREECGAHGQAAKDACCELRPAEFAGSGTQGGGRATAELAEIASAVGSDVPFFVSLHRNRASAAEISGIGERVEIVPPEQFCAVLLKPPIEISAAEIYTAYDENMGLNETSPGAAEPPEKCTQKRTNDLEKIAINRYPIINETIEFLYACAAGKSTHIAMSGSGPTVFALFDDFSCAKECYEHAAPFCEEAVLTRAR